MTLNLDGLVVSGTVPEGQSGRPDPPGFEQGVSRDTCNLPRVSFQKVISKYLRVRNDGQDDIYTLSIVSHDWVANDPIV